MSPRRSLSISAIAITACGALAACSSAAPPVLKAAGPSTPAQSAQAAAVVAPLTPVIAPADQTPMGAFAKRLATVIDGAKSQVTPFPIDLEGLPRVTVQESLDAKGAAKLDRSKLSEDAELTVKPAEGYARQYMLSFGFKDMSKVAFAHIRVQGQYGVNEGWFGSGFGNTMNTYLTCGGAAELVPVHSETLRFENGRAIYTMSNAVLDRQACRMLSVQKWTASAKPLLPNGILYGFRACVGSCKESEELTLLFPRTAASAAGALGGGADHLNGAFSVVAFPIQRGGGGAFIARIMRRDVDPWQIPATEMPTAAKTGLPVDDSARVNALFLTSFELGVEVSQATDDEAAVAIAYMDIDPATIAPVLAPAPTAKATPTPPSGRIGFNLLDSRN